MKIKHLAIGVLLVALAGTAIAQNGAQKRGNAGQAQGQQAAPGNGQGAQDGTGPIHQPSTCGVDCPCDGSGQMTGPRDGSGPMRGNGAGMGRGRMMGPQDGSGPQHTPGTGGGMGAGYRRGRA